MLNNRNIILSTNRLFLREMGEDDLPFLKEIFDEASAMTFYPMAQKQEKAKIWIGHMLDSYKKDGFGTWLCFLKKDKKFIGQCGIMKNEISGKQEIELGYTTLIKYWNQGFATEAAAACINHAFKNLDISKIVSLIEKENVASVIIAEKLGMKKTHRVERWDKITDLYSIERS